ncbi:MAG: hypothetical protein JSR86_19540 [Proteobacteria bacterium]|nr:hypothetical protein [Pseudomonadota bacterium]
MCPPRSEWEAVLFAPLAVKPVAPPVEADNRQARRKDRAVSWRWAWYGRP